MKRDSSREFPAMIMRKPTGDCLINGSQIAPNGFWTTRTSKHGLTRGASPVCGAQAKVSLFPMCIELNADQLV
jgi:hypothetical protein